MNLIIKSTKQTLLYAFFSILCSLIIIRDLMNVGVPNMAFAIIVLVAALFLKIDKFKIFLFFLFPFTCGIPGYTMLVSIIALFFKSISKIKLRKLQVIPILFIAFLEFFNCIIHTGDVDTSAYLSFMSFTAVFFFLLFDKDNYKQSRECILAFIFGTVFVAFIIYYKMIEVYGLDMILMGKLRGAMGDVYEEGAGKLITNGNNMAYLSIVLIGILMLGAKRLRLPAILYNSLLVLSILIGMGSFSRTWMLLFALIIVAYLLHERNLKALFSLVIIFGAVILLFPNILAGFTNVMTDRMAGDNIETGGGRTVIFNQYNEVWSQSILYVLFGTSLTSYHEVTNISGSMHNSIQQIYVTLGLIGLLLYIGLFIKFFNTKNVGKPSLFNYLPFFAGAMFLQSIQFLEPYFLMLPLIPACYAFLVRDFDSNKNT